jgi:hypothetical protein
LSPPAGWLAQNSPLSAEWKHNSFLYEWPPAFSLSSMIPLPPSEGGLSARRVEIKVESTYVEMVLFSSTDYEIYTVENTPALDFARTELQCARGVHEG